MAGLVPPGVFLLLLLTGAVDKTDSVPDISNLAKFLNSIESAVVQLNPAE